MLRRDLMRPLVLALCLLGGLPAHAHQMTGLQQAGIQNDTQPLQLNGAGRHRKFLFDLYDLALYLQRPTHDASEVLASDQVKQLRLHALRNLPRSQVLDAFRKGLLRCVEPGKRAEMAQSLSTLSAAIPDIHRGDSLVFTYVPGQGAILEAPGQRRVRVPGKDFADALFSMWLGPNSETVELKDKLLGNG